MVSLSTRNYPPAYCCYIDGRPSKVSQEDMDMASMPTKQCLPKIRMSHVVRLGFGHGRRLLNWTVSRNMFSVSFPGFLSFSGTRLVFTMRQINQNFSSFCQ